MIDKDVILREFLIADYDNLKNEIVNAKFMMQWAGPKYVYPLTLEQVKSQINAIDYSNEKKNFLYSFILKDSLKTIGHVQLSIVDRENKIANVGSVMVYSEFRKLGFGQELMNQLLETGFFEKGMNELRLGVFDFNTIAINCYKSLGFKEYSFEKDSKEICGEKWNLLRMKLSKDEYTACNQRKRCVRD